MQGGMLTWDSSLAQKLDERGAPGAPKDCGGSHCAGLWRLWNGRKRKKIDLISKLRGELAAGSPEETGSHFFFFFLFRRKGAEFDSGEESDFD